MKKIFIPLLCFLMLLGCKKAEEKSDSPASEKEEGLAQENKKQVSKLKKNAKASENQASMLLNFGSETIINEDDFSANILLYKTAINIELRERESKILLGISGKETFAQKPIQGVFSRSSTGNHKMAILMAYIVDKNAKGKFIACPGVYEGTLTISKLSEEEIIIEITGKGGLLKDMHNTEAWKDINAKIVCKKPRIIAQEVEKESLYY